MTWTARAFLTGTGDGFEAFAILGFAWASRSVPAK
jgi:hypothetical protein